MAVIGGGLAGLALAIQTARAGYRTILFEKEKYPFHKVCGEYVGLESWNFLEELGVPLSDMQLPVFNRLLLSDPQGNSIETDLPLGGFGISRHLLEQLLAEIARKEGVILLEDTRVIDVVYQNNSFIVFSSKGETEVNIAAGAFGRRSNLDTKWKRAFTQVKPNKLNHYVGVKYHLHANLPQNILALHNFENGYCGICPIEGNKHCLYYLTTARNLRKYHNDIGALEKAVLFKNPFLEKILTQAECLMEEPLTASRLSFNIKNQVQNHLLMIGDSAGMITPICGNGISMALLATKLAFEEINQFMHGKISRYEMEMQYTQQWEKNFSRRLQIGRFVLRFLGTGRLSNILVTTSKPFPKFIAWLIRQTHGKPF